MYPHLYDPFTDSHSTTTTVLMPDIQQQTADRQRMIECLNEDLAGELQSLIMYLQLAGVLRRMKRTELRELFEIEIPDEQRHAEVIAEAITELGGCPTTTPRPVLVAEDVDSMLRNIVEVEKLAISDFTARAAEAASLGEFALHDKLERILADKMRHKQDLEGLLDNWVESDTDFA